MKNILKSKKTTIIGIIAILGLIYHAITNGGFNVQDFLALVLGVGFILSKDADQTHSGNITNRSSIFGNGADPSKEQK